jgi:glycosyltransferase involved in cell wall biosynthesis
MSEWYRRWLVEQVGVPAEHVTVVGAGLNNPPAQRPPDPARDRVLFVGVDFHRKGGDLVVEACARLRASGSRAIALTVAGPSRWPLSGPPPPWVRFLGRVEPAGLASLYASHDVFAMPSRFEAYGIALLEARAAGLPCIARDAMAMPELVADGVNGRLVLDDDIERLATVIDACLGDQAMLERTVAEAPEVRASHSWQSVAGTMVDTITRSIDR